MDDIARDKIIHDIDHNYLVEAGAGTGKTTLLVGRILHIITSGRATLPQIVAITFTEKAGQELKIRIQQAIEQELSKILDTSVHVYLERALQDIEHSVITTIHGFCSSILRDWFLEARLPCNMDVADEGASNILFAQIWEEWLNTRLQQQDEFLLKLLRFGITNKNIGKVAKLLHQHRDVFDFFSPSKLNYVQKSWQSLLKNEIAFIETLLPNCKNTRDNGYIAIQEMLPEWRYLSTLSEKDWQLQGMYGIPVKVAGNKKNWSPANTLTIIKQRLNEMKKKFQELKSTSQHNLLQDCMSWLQIFLKHYQQVKFSKKLLDFTDLLLYTRTLLQTNKEVRKELQKQYEFILVDEFQDTDPLQTEILFFLAEQDAVSDVWKHAKLAPGKFFAVGDPKQAIYRFRRADIEIYEEVKQLLGPDACLHIVRNFRSDPDIISWINTCFSQLIQKEAYQPEYIPLYASKQGIKNRQCNICVGGGVSHKKSLQEIDTSCVTSSEKTALEPMSGNPISNFSAKCIAPDDGDVEDGNDKDDSMTPSLPDGNDQDDSMTPSLSKDANLLAGMMFQMVEEKWPILTKNGQRPITFGDMALLLRRFTYIDIFEQGLIKRNIPYQIIGGRSFYSRVEIRSLIFLLKAIVEPYDTLSLVSALKSPIFGLAEEELLERYQKYRTLDYRHAPEDTSSEISIIYGLLRELHEQSMSQDVTSFFEDVLEKTGLLFTFFSLPQGQQRLSNLQKAREMAYDFAQKTSPNVVDFVSWLFELESNNESESEGYVAEESGDFVKICTIHKAKGLEFPAVFLGDLGYTIQTSDDIFVSKEKNSIALRLLGREPITTKNFQELQSIEKAKTTAEEKRLLYVATTRAKDYIIMSNVFFDKGDGQQLAPFASYPIALSTFVKHAPSPSIQTNTPMFDLVDSFQNWQTRLEQSVQNAQQASKIVSIENVLARVRPKPPNVFLAQRWQKSCLVLEKTLATLEDSVLLSQWPTSPAMFASVVPILDYIAYQHGLTASETEQIRSVIPYLMQSDVLKNVRTSEWHVWNMPFSWKYKENWSIYGTLPLIYGTQDIATVLLLKMDDISEQEARSIAHLYQWEAALYSSILEKVSGWKIANVIIFFLPARLVIASQFDEKTKEQLANILEKCSRSM